MVKASAFFLRREWPLTAPESLDFMTARTETVGTTLSLLPAPDMLLGQAVPKRCLTLGKLCNLALGLAVHSRLGLKHALGGLALLERWLAADPADRCKVLSGNVGYGTAGQAS